MAKRERVDGAAYPIDESVLVSIITINYNQAELTRQFLDSATTLTYPNYELIIVDNASVQPLSTRIDLHQYPCVRLIRSEVNLGFTGGNNLGIQAAKGDYYFIVNNDTELSPALLDELLKPFRENEKIGVTCPKIKFFDLPRRYNTRGIIQLIYTRGRLRPLGITRPMRVSLMSHTPRTSPMAAP